MVAQTFCGLEAASIPLPLLPRNPLPTTPTLALKLPAKELGLEGLGVW